MEIGVDALPEDPAALRAIILAQRAEIVGMAASGRAYEALIQALKITIARLKKQKYGPSSEKIEREIDQLELALEDLEMAVPPPTRRRKRASPQATRWRRARTPPAPSPRQAAHRRRRAA